MSGSSSLSATGSHARETEVDVTAVILRFTGAAGRAANTVFVNNSSMKNHIKVMQRNVRLTNTVVVASMFPSLLNAIHE